MEGAAHMDDPRWSYLEGYEAASNPEPLKCPHAHGTAESEQWWDGVGDGLSAMIDAKLALRPGEDARAVALIAKLREAKSSDEAVAIAAKAIRHAEDDAIEQCAVASRHGVSARRDKTMPKRTQTRSHAVAAERPPHPAGVAV